jgi:hypothetical protein
MAEEQGAGRGGGEEGAERGEAGAEEVGAVALEDEKDGS